MTVDSTGYNPSITDSNLGLTATQVLFGSSGGGIGQKSTFAWDNTNDRLYIGLDGGGDFDVTKSKTATLTVRCWNQSNTASAHALHDLLVGGTSGGDPKTYYRVMSGATWVVGCDNSDGDKLKISTDSGGDPGTSTRFTIDTSGNVGIGTDLSAGNGNLRVAKNTPIANGLGSLTVVGAYHSGSGYFVSSETSGSIETFFGSQSAYGGLFGTNSNHPVDIYTNGTRKVTFGATGGLTIVDAYNISVDTTTGTKIGTATTQKLGFWNATPIVQPSSTGETGGFTAGAGTAMNSDSTSTGNSGTKAYTFGDVVKHLKAAGILASS